MAENIIAKLGLQGLSEGERLQAIDRMSEIVGKRVILRVMEQLPEADVEEANRLAGDPERLFALLASRFDMEDIVLEETERLKNELFLEASEPTAGELANSPEKE